jgi:hypothetical protein
MTEIEQRAKKSSYVVWVFDYEIEDYRAVAGFETLAEAVELAESTDGKLEDACLAVSRCFTIGEPEVRDWAGRTLWEL